MVVRKTVDRWEEDVELSISLVVRTMLVIRLGVCDAVVVVVLARCVNAVADSSVVVMSSLLGLR